MRILSLASFMLLSLVTMAQQMEVLNVNLINDFTNANQNSVKSTTCGPDTVRYTLEKATGLSALSINNSTSASGISQYYNAPQAITISGLDFYAYKLNATGGISINTTVSVYLAGVDSMPTGLPLATATVPVDTAFGGGQLSVLRKTAAFAPITLTAPYVVVFENNSANGVGLIFNSYSAGDGALEWLSSVKLGPTWIRSYGIMVGGTPFDADMLMYPVVNYDLAASYVATNACLTAGPTVFFTNTSSPVLFDRMYNVYEFYGITDQYISWNYGDGSPVENVIDGLHVYSGSANVEFDVLLSVSMMGWSAATCTHDTIGLVGDSLSVDFLSNPTSGTNVSFTNGTYTTSGASGYLWDFGDGNTSTQVNPNHTFPVPGNYTVCLTVITNCGSADSTCHTVVVDGCPNPTPGFTFTQTGIGAFDFTNTSTSTGSAGYSWSMGDGTTYNTQDASHTYGANGVYNVTLIVTDSCGVDSLTLSLTVGGIGIGELNSVEFSCFPNPTTDKMTVKAGAVMTELELISTSGQSVLKMAPSAVESEIPVHKFAEGQYLLRVQFDDQSVLWSRVIIKQ